MRLHEFITVNRDEIVALTANRFQGRPWPSISAPELGAGIPLFLTQLVDTLPLARTGANVVVPDAIGVTAAKYGGDLLRMGFNVNQVVHVYGDVCQAITQLALDQNAAITVEEFKLLNGCLDTAIAEAVMEHARLVAEARPTVAARVLTP